VMLTANAKVGIASDTFCAERCPQTSTENG